MATANEIFAESDGILAEELGVLESIYISEFSVEKDEQGWPNTVSVLLHPSTGMDHSKKYVCMTVNFHLPHNYPEDIPHILVSNPRGLAEEEIHSLVEDMKKLAEERKDGPMLYELIEMAKDCLTEGNLPHCECAICLEHFEEGDDFLKTDCYHYFHRICLARCATAFLAQLQKEEEDPSPLHVMKQEEKILGCPMCRLPLTCDLADLMATPEQTEELVKFVPSSELLQQQKEMAERYQLQKEQGGIIDLEHEKNKYLVDENTVVSLPSLKKDPESVAPTSTDVSTTGISPVRDSRPSSTRGRGYSGGHASSARGRDIHRPNSGRGGPHRDPHHHHGPHHNPHHHRSDRNKHQGRDDRGDRKDHRDKRKDLHRDRADPHGGRRDFRDEGRPGDRPNSRGNGRQQGFTDDSRGFQSDRPHDTRSDHRENRRDICNNRKDDRRNMVSNSGQDETKSSESCEKEEKGFRNNDKEGKGRSCPLQDSNSSHLKLSDRMKAVTDDDLGESESLKGGHQNNWKSDRDRRQSEDSNPNPTKPTRGGERDRDKWRGTGGQNRGNWHARRNPGYHEKEQQRYSDQSVQSGKASPRGTTKENVHDGRNLSFHKSEEDAAACISAATTNDSRAVDTMRSSSQFESSEGPAEQCFGRDRGKRGGRHGRGGRGRDRPFYADSNSHRNSAPRNKDANSLPQREDKCPASRDDNQRQDNPKTDRHVENEDTRKPPKNHWRHDRGHGRASGKTDHQSSSQDQDVRAEEINGKSSDVPQSGGNNWHVHKAVSKDRTAADAGHRKGAPPGFHISGPPSGPCHKDSINMPSAGDGAKVKPPPGFQSF